MPQLANAIKSIAYGEMASIGVFKVHLHNPTDCVIRHTFHRQDIYYFCCTALAEVVRHNFH
jgi:hypothetical protein